MSTRRAFIQGSATACVVASATPAVAAPRAALTHADLYGPLLDLRTGPGNALAMARLTGSLDPQAIKYGWYTGRLRAVVPGAAVRDLVGVVGFSAARTLPKDALGRYALLRRECGFFVDLDSGAVLDTWTNPYTNERVEVVHIANDPVNQMISPVRTGERLYEEQVTQRAEQPYVLPWQHAGRRAFVEVAAHLWAKNPLDPAVWVRESSGAQIQISDMQSYSCDVHELQDAARPSVDYQGNWVHLRPWQPWMLMGTAPGHLLYHCFTGSASSIEAVPPHIVALVSTRLPQFLTPPDKPGKSEGSLSRFMRTRKPAPALATPPGVATTCSPLPEVRK